MTSISKSAILLLVFLTTFSDIVFPQNKKGYLFSPTPSKTTAAELLKRPLVLCMREVNPKTAEKLTKKDPQQLASMEIYNKYYNDTMKYYFEKYYKGSKSIELKSKAEVDKLLNSSSSDVTVIVSGDLSRDYQVEQMTKSQDTYSFEMILPDKKGDRFTVSLMNGLLSDADFVFVIQQINTQLQNIINGSPLPSYDYSNKNTAVKLKNLKLIINPGSIDEGITKEEVQKNYSLPFEYVDSVSDYEKIIVAQTPGYAYIMPLWSSPLWGPAFAMVDAGTGEILSVLSAGGVRFSFAPKTTSEVETRNMGPMEKRNYEQQHMIEIIRSKPKYNLKDGHLKRFAKLAMEGE